MKIKQIIIIIGYLAFISAVSYLLAVCAAWLLKWLLSIGFNINGGISIWLIGLFVWITVATYSGIKNNNKK